jgi:hypothetical protein
MATPLKPTRIGAVSAEPSSGVAAVMDRPTSTIAGLGVMPSQTMAMTPAQTTAITVIDLDPEHRQFAEAQLAKFDFAKMPAQDLILIGREAEQGLVATLDGFLGRLNKTNSLKLFDLVSRLQKGVDDAKLDQILDEIEKNHQSNWHKLTSFFKSREAIEKAAREAFQAAVDQFSGKSKTMVDTCNVMDKDMNVELNKLRLELGEFDALRRKHRDSIIAYAVATWMANQLLLQGRQYVEQLRQELVGVTDPVKLSDFRDQETKLKNVESRAMTLEQRWTRLPGDDELKRMLQEAGVTEYLQTSSSWTDRLINIKETLIAISFALTVKGTQDLKDKGQKMDQQLDAVRARVTKQVITKAANAAGDNVMENVEKGRKLIEEIKQLAEIVKAADAENERKMQEGRVAFKQQRDELAQLVRG